MINGIATGAGQTAVTSQMRQALFRKLDTNGDGVIDKTELMAALEASRGQPKGSKKESPTVDKAMAKLDANGDGVISEAEFSAAMSAGGGSSLFVGSTSSLVDFLMSGTSGTGQNMATNGVLKNYLAQCSRLVKQEATEGLAGII